MAKNVFIKVPSYGDAVVGDRTTREVLFITHKSFSMENLDQNKYEIQGVVGARYGREVLIIAKENKVLPWADKIVMEVKDAILDGNEHEGTILYRAKSAPNDVISVVVKYAAMSLQDVADAINDVVLTSADMVQQNWHAFVRENKLLLSYEFSFMEQNNNTMSGFKLVKDSFMSNINAALSLRFKHGKVVTYGPIISMNRAKTFYSTAVGTADIVGNVSSDIEDIGNRFYPINKSTYLGKSADGKDHCSALRRVYGEGETGWLNLMNAMTIVSPTDAGTLGIKDGLQITSLIASHVTSGGVSISPAAAYCIHYGTEVISAGNWFLPTMANIKDILQNIRYNSEPIENCRINQMLTNLGGDKISNDRRLWSCNRCLWSTAYAAITYGIISDNAMYAKNLTIPITLYRM